MFDNILEFFKSLDKRLVIVISLVGSITAIWTIFGLPSPMEINDQFQNTQLVERVDKLEQDKAEVEDHTVLIDRVESLEQNMLVTSGVLRSLCRQLKHENPDGDVIILYQLPVIDNNGNPSFDYENAGREGDKLHFIECCDWQTAIYNSEKDMYFYIDFDGKMFWITDTHLEGALHKVIPKREVHLR